MIMSVTSLKSAATIRLFGYNGGQPAVDMHLFGAPNTSSH